MKQYTKALDDSSKAFAFLRNKFPRLGEAKVKAGVFVGPQIRKLLADSEFPNLLTNVERKALLSFNQFVENFLGNT